MVYRAELTKEQMRRSPQVPQFIYAYPSVYFCDLKNNCQIRGSHKGTLSSLKKNFMYRN